MTGPARLRWLLLATHVPPTGAGGGMVRYTVEMARALARHPDVDLAVAAGRDSCEIFATIVGEPSRVWAVPPFPVVARSWLERRGAGMEVLRQPWDVVQGTKHLVPRRSRAHRLLTVHDMLPLDRANDFSRVKRRLLPAPYLASIRDADTVLCVSEATRDRVCCYVPSARARTVVVPSALSSALRSAPPRPVPSLRDVPFALVVGDDSTRKNLPLIVDMWEAIETHAPGASLVVVGPPSWGSSMRGSAFDALVADGRVLHLHHVDEGTLRWCYEHARVVLCPSLLEGFGLPALEAMAFGAPVVTSDDAALCEVTVGRAVHMGSRDAHRWRDAVVAQLHRPREPRPASTPRSWDDVADETVRAVRRAS